jgi:hypothetical protein
VAPSYNHLFYNADRYSFDLLVMSLGFSIGDFIATGELAHRLYKEVYMVAREAPEAVQQLFKELPVMHQSIEILIQEVQNPDSVLAAAGQPRVDSVNQLMVSTRETLDKLEKLANKYELLSRKPTDRRKLRFNSLRLKFAKDASHIADLRGKIGYHCNLLQLLLTSAGNSSLERLHANDQVLKQNQEKMNALLENMHLAEQARNRMNEPSNLPAPIITAVVAQEVQMRLSEEFIQSSEQRVTWPEVSVDVWLDTAAHWLGKARYMLNRSQIFQASGSPTQLSAYAQTIVDLLKASWIIKDVVNMHPQRAYITSGKRTIEIAALAKAVTGELDALTAAGLVLPTLSSLISDVDYDIFDPSAVLNGRFRSLLDGQDAMACYERARVVSSGSACVFDLFDHKIHRLTYDDHKSSDPRSSREWGTIFILDGAKKGNFEVRLSFPNKPGKAFYRKVSPLSHLLTPC